MAIHYIHPYRLEAGSTYKAELWAILPALPDITTSTGTSGSTDTQEIARQATQTWRTVTKGATVFDAGLSWEIG